jgi:hypothetical protein
MRHLTKGIIGCVCSIATMGSIVLAAEAVNPSTLPDPIPTHADAAVILAKFSGLFDRYVDSTADLNECVKFLNTHGIYFGLMEVVNGTEFSKEDCARAMGQIELLLSGEAEFEHGKVSLPKEVDSWKDFCILNDVKYVEGYQSMLELVRVATLQFRE